MTNHQNWLLLIPTKACTGIHDSPASALALFQRAMDGILQGIPQVVCYMDNILVTGTSAAEHAANLEEVLKRLKEHGLRLREKKCTFYQESVQYLGHTIDCFGIHTSPTKVAAVADAPTPQNVSRLRSFLGMVNHYGKFIPNLSAILQPLHRLLRTSQKSDKCDRAFKEGIGLTSVTGRSRKPSKA